MNPRSRHSFGLPCICILCGRDSRESNAADKRSTDITAVLLGQLGPNVELLESRAHDSELVKKINVEYRYRGSLRFSFGNRLEGDSNTFNILGDRDRETK